MLKLCHMLVDGLLNRQTARQMARQMARQNVHYQLCHPIPPHSQVQCLIPIPGMESTFQEYQSFSDSVVVTEESLPAYTRAKKRLEGYLPFENQLVRSDTVDFELASSQTPTHLAVPHLLCCS